MAATMASGTAEPGVQGESSSIMPGNLSMMGTERAGCCDRECMRVAERLRA